MVMAWGDGLAALVGERFGRRRYHVGGHARSIEGSATMFAASLVSTLGCFAYLSGVSVVTAVPAAVGISLVGTFVEAVSPKGLDNLTVPLTVAWAAEHVFL
jgi:phytol kinase